MVIGTWQNIEYISRTIVIGDIESDTINPIIEYILHINHNDKLNIENDKNYKPQPIKLMINSYGGEIYYALGLCDIIEKSITPIHTYGIGAVMSSGFLIFMYGKQRFAYKNCTFMYHQVSTKFEGKLKGQEADLKECKRLQALYDKAVVSKCKLTQKQLEAVNTTHKDWFFDSKEALKYKIIEKIL